jgi:hypothetical protein
MMAYRMLSLNFPAADIRGIVAIKRSSKKHIKAETIWPELIKSIKISKSFQPN